MIMIRLYACKLPSFFQFQRCLPKHVKCLYQREIVSQSHVEAERFFSAGELFLTKCSRMSDSTLDKLMFLKFFFALNPKSTMFPFGNIF